jgi:phosphopantetheinyl transferase
MKSFAAEPFSERLAQFKEIGSFKVVHIFLPFLAKLVAADGYDGVAANFLSKAELARLLDFSSEKRRCEWLGGRLAAKEAVADCLDGGERSPRGIEILVEENGRPYVTKEIGKAPYISISHSGEYAVAVAVHSPCGIDVQEVKQTLIRVVDRFASPKEQEMLAGVLPQGWPQARQLALLWSAKEAVRKMIDLEPLLGFSEMVLEEIKGPGTAGAPISIVLSCRREKECKVRVKVLAVAEDDYMLALTCLY